MLILLVLLQALLHHCFDVLMDHVNEVSEGSNLYSVEFQTNSKSKTMSISFWEGGRLVDIELGSILWEIPVGKGEMNLISQLQSTIGTSPQNINCRGCNADFWKALDQDLYRQAGIQYPFCLESTDIEKLIYEPSYSVLEGIDMSPLLPIFLPRIGGILGKRWLQSTNFLRIVSQDIISRHFVDLIVVDVVRFF